MCPASLTPQHSWSLRERGLPARLEDSSSTRSLDCRTAAVPLSTSASRLLTAASSYPSDCNLHKEPAPCGVTSVTQVRVAHSTASGPLGLLACAVAHLCAQESTAACSLASCACSWQPPSLLTPVLYAALQAASAGAWPARPLALYQPRPSSAHGAMV